MEKNKYFLLFLILIFTSSNAELIDLGVHGKTYSKGSSFEDELKTRYKNYDKKKLEDEVIKKRKAVLKLENDLPTCQKTISKEFVPTIKLSNSINVPIVDKVIEEANKEINILERFNIFFPYHVLFIDVNDKKQRFLAEELSNKYNIRVFIAKGDLSNIEFSDYIQVARKDIELKSFNVECLPTLYTQKNFMFIKNEYNLEELIND